MPKFLMSFVDIHDGLCCIDFWLDYETDQVKHPVIWFALDSNGLVIAQNLQVCLLDFISLVQQVGQANYLFENWDEQGVFEFQNAPIHACLSKWWPFFH